MFTSVAMRESIGGVATTTATEMMMVASTRGDLDLNDAPPPAYEYPVMEGLKHAMIQHEMVFKNQVRELHRLYWRQRSLMNEVYWKQYVPMSLHQQPAEKKAGDMRSCLPTVNWMGMKRTSSELHTNSLKSFDLHLPADRSIHDAAKGVTNAFVEGHSSGFGECVLGARHSSGFKAMADDAANPSHSRVTVSSEFCSVSRIWNESGHRLSEKCSHTEHQNERWQEQNILSNAGLKEHGGFLSADFLTEKQQPKYKLLHIDLNVAQDDEPVDVFPNTVETFPSPSTSSSVVCHGDKLRISRSNRSEKESTVTVQPGLVCLGSENSREKSDNSLPHEARDSYPPSVQASVQSSNVTDNNWNYKEHIADNEVCGSGIRSSEECCKILAERFSRDYNGKTQGRTNGTVLTDFHCAGKKNIDSSAGQISFVAHSDNRKNASISSNNMENSYLHASPRNTSLPPNICGGLEDKETHNEGSDEDTVSSHAIAPDEKHRDELKQCPRGIMHNQLTGDSECTSKKKSVADHAVISNLENSVTTHSDSVMPEGICRKQVPNIEASSHTCIQDKPCNSKALPPKEDLARITKLDNIILKAAEMLLSMSSENPLHSLDQLANHGQAESEFTEGNDQPRSSDSFEIMTLKLPEEVTDVSSICATQIDNETRKDVCGVRLRRGTRLRDFQKDILPGMVSLSRHEICEDLYAIKHEFRKKRSRKVLEDNWLRPVRSRRSSLYNVSKRR